MCDTRQVASHGLGDGEGSGVSGEASLPSSYVLLRVIDNGEHEWEDGGGKKQMR